MQFIVAWWVLLHPPLKLSSWPAPCLFQTACLLPNLITICSNEIPYGIITWQLCFVNIMKQHTSCWVCNTVQVVKVTYAVRSPMLRSASKWSFLWYNNDVCDVTICLLILFYCRMEMLVSGVDEEVRQRLANYSDTGSDDVRNLATHCELLLKWVSTLCSYYCFTCYILKMEINLPLVAYVWNILLAIFCLWLICFSS